MLITTPGLAEAAVRAAEGSRVRQVIAFGAALDTIHFAQLSGLDAVPLPRLDARTQFALRPGGGAALTHRDLLGAMADLDGGVGLTESDVVLVTWPPGDGADLVALVGLAVAKGALLVAAHGLADADLTGTVHDFGVTVTALDGQPLARLWRERSPSMPSCYPHMP
ncbi:hypothetical protein [Nonomuraea africana]|uniref:hypothetical protein n=1 Tax=Nonomuraea africana TaxID=46171 RepID=UPI0033F08C32